MPMLHQRGFKIEVLKGTNELGQDYEIAYVDFDQIKELMSEEEHKSFSKWMRGQTVIAEGCYPHDLERFLAGLPIID
jgi:hypothetical protein